MFDDFVRQDSTPLYKSITGQEVRSHLLWGDGVEILQDGNHRVKVRARGRFRTGYVEKDALGGSSLLEIYFIDVGQGDGILIKTPNFRHVMIDGGYPRTRLPTRKSAADFVDWKFYEDYKQDEIKLDVMIASHCDADHYGGLWDLLDISQMDELDAVKVYIKSFYHPGIAWWKKPNGRRWLGPYQSHNNQNYFTQLMGSRQDVINSLSAGSQPRLQGWWSQFMQTVVDSTWINNQPTAIEFLSNESHYVPDFSPGVIGEPSMKILGPVEFHINGKPAIHRFSGGDDKNTNGNSMLIRMDFGRARILLTGDLNKVSQHALLEDYIGQRQEFQCDVAKCCHHGSEDISYEFLKTMQPAATIISSGDNEGHGHPRPSLIAASGTTGYFELKDDELISPLIYSTEIARSISLGKPTKLEEIDTTGTVLRTLDGPQFERSIIHFNEVKVGDLQPKKKRRKIENTYVVAGLLYGLVNVRTDGEKILCGTMNEKDYTWDIKKITSRF